MKDLFIYLSLFFLPLAAAEAKIIETASIADAVQYIDQESWFLVDLDNTLYEAKQALGHANWLYDEVQQRVDQGMGREETIRDLYPFWMEIQDVCNVQPLEDATLPTLKALQSRGIVVMGLTHRQPCIAKITLKQVDSLGFDFSVTAPSQDCFTTASVSPTLYSRGILFVGDYNQKGEVFLQFLSLIKQTPKKVVFIDDKKKNVEELERTLSAHGIDYVGIYYTAIDHVKPVYSKPLADCQLKYLHRIMSNEAASVLIEAGLE